MPRPRLCRRIRFQPGVTYFKPAGVRMIDLTETILTLEEFEAIRLVDLEETEQSKAGKQMKISQPTLSRLLKSARKKLSDAIINGKAIKIQGGTYKMAQPRGRGLGMGRGLGQGQGRGLGIGPGGRMGGFAAGPGGNCKCPTCGYEEQQVRGQPCMSKKCPKCSTLMTRA
ncbi:MAG TPA: DUF134 domain-containing protein [Candidatus Nanoarchaeia archaeon]|nr:DUF134 domain-containing protein [Candidatus Nanoarchaeia archaeon]